MSNRIDMILKNQKFLLDIKCQNLQKVCQLLTQFQVSRHEFEWSATVRFKLVLNSFKICQTVGTIEQKLQQEKVYSRMIKIFLAPTGALEEAILSVRACVCVSLSSKEHCKWVSEAF